MSFAHSTSIWAVRIMRRRPGPGVRVARLTDPLALGVHEAADGNQVPPFVPRDRLPELVEALGRGGFVLVSGDAAAGKTRLAYEAMHVALPHHRCVVPDDPEVLPAALDTAPSVLWLDDLERYLDVLTAADVTRANTVVLATMRTRARDRVAHRHDAVGDHVDHEPARAVLAAVTTEIHLDRIWSGPELIAAAHAPDPRIVRATAGRYGIAEQLAARPDIVVGAAVADLRRAGYREPVSLAMLRALSGSDAIGSSLLEPVGADRFVVSGYLPDRDEPVPDAVWAAIAAFGEPAALREVAWQAAFAGNHDFLRAAYDKTLAHKDFTTSAALASMLGAAGFDVADRFTELADLADDAVPPDELADLRLRQVWHTGATVDGRGDPERAAELARTLVRDCTDLFGTTAEPTLRSRITLVRNTGDLPAARALLADATTILGPTHDITLAARFEEAYQARDADGPRVAVRLYYALLGDLDALGAVSPSLYVATQWHLGSALLAAGETESAGDVLEVAVENALLCHGPHHGTTLEIRLSRIAALDAAERHDEALELAERLAADAERMLGPDHPTTSDTRFAVADISARRA